MTRLLTAAVALLTLASAYGAGETAKIDGVDYTVISGLRRTDFNLRFGVSKYKVATKPTVCVLLNYQDAETHYRAEIGWNGSKLFRVEGGMSLPIGYDTSDGLPKSGEAEIVIKRRETLLCVVVDGRVVAQAYDDSFHRGKLALGVKGGPVSFSRLVKQPYAKVIFTTDFMQSTKEARSFTDVSGIWKINSLDNPSLSANAFSFQGRGSEARPAASVVGGWSWDDYTFTVSARHSGSRVGIYFYYRDEANYYLFRWGPRGGKSGVKELIKCRNGKKTVVATAKGGYLLRQWYSLGVDIQGDLAVVHIDGHEVLRHHDRDLAFGKVGLYTEDKVGTTFDDANVIGRGYLDDDFTGKPILWQPMGGEWKAIGEGAARCYQAKTSAPGKAVAGETRWDDYSVAVDITPPTKGAAGLCLHYLDEVNYYWVLLDAHGKVSLGRTTEARRKQLVEVVLPPKLLAKAKLRLEASYLDGIIRVTVDGTPLIETWDPSIRHGKIGLLAIATEVNFDNVRVSFPEERRSVLTYNEVFESETSMEAWARPQSDWLPSRMLGMDAGDANTHWHRGDFFGDVDLEARLGEPEDEEWSASLIVSAQKPQPDSGYRLELARDGSQALRLLRNGATVAEKDLGGGRPVRKMKLTRRGPFVFGYLDEELMLRYRDDAPIDGSMVAVREAGIAFIRKDTEIFCPNVSSFTFAKAPCDWRSSGGEWAVSERWSCDPRWSWFYGGSKSGLASIWHKGHFAGDVTLEFCAAIRMDSKDNPGYRNSRDMNATICSDGRGMNTGYGFILGGFGNTKSCITRNGKIVASTRSVKLSARESQHRQWWYIKIVKKGADLRFYVDNRLVLEYTDPEPLTGDRVALWTYKDALMVARVRVAAQDTSKSEAPSFAPPPIGKCIYDLK